MIFARIPNVLIALFCCLSAALFSQTTTFQQTYGAAGYDAATDVLETPDGYLIAGETFDSMTGHTNALLLHMNKQGVVLWKKTYGQFDNDGFRKVQPANDGGYIAWGTTRDFNNNRTDGWLVKVDAGGNLVWQKTIDVPGFSCYAYGEIVALPGGYIFSGIKSKPGYSQTFVCRVDNDGNTVWSRFTPSSYYNSLATAYIADSSVYLTGTVNDFGCVRTMDATTGAITQSNEYQVDTTNWPLGVHPTPDGGHLFSGVVIPELSGLNHYHGWVQKMDAVGQTLWSKWYKITDKTWIDASVVLPDGSCVFSMDYSPEINSPVTYSALVKIDAQGQVVWARRFGGTQTVYFQKIIPTADGGLFATGFTRTPAGVNDDQNAFWIKTDSTGVVNGCCVANLNIIVEDLAPTQREIPFTSSAFENMVPSEIAEADTAKLDIQDICVNVQPVIHPTLAFCPGTTVTLGDSTYSQPGVVEVVLPSTTGGCDTLATYTLEWLNQPVLNDTIAFCPGTSVTLGDSVYTQPGVVTIALPDTTGGCDTLATYTLEWLNQPTFSQTITFCPGDSVTLGDQTYGQPGIFSVTLPATTGGCDTLVIYTLEWLSQPVLNDTIGFCPGTSVTLGDSTYSQPGVVILHLPSTSGGCDTLVTHTLQWLNQPTFSQTITFCPGDSVTLGDQTYSQPGIFSVTLPSTNGGCDTLAIYTLESATNQPSSLQLTCPNDLTVVVPPGANGTVVDYNLPTAVSDCSCPGLTVELTTGATVGSIFPIGVNTICYRAEDACGQSKTCCFTIQVEADNACDIKNNGCVKFELLTVQRDSSQKWVYRVRVTNQCTAEMTYAYVQVPTGIVAAQPTNNSQFTTTAGNVYNVRNPNFSPFYSLRFQPIATGLVNGQSDVFRYVLPAQADVEYIHVAVRLASGTYVEAYLNTFNCPVGTAQRPESTDRSNKAFTPTPLTVFPNPVVAGGGLFVAGREIPAGTFLLQDVMGRTRLQTRIENNEILDKTGLEPGVYLFKIIVEGQFIGSGKLSIF